MTDWYVDPNAAGGGDGSEGLPFDSLRDAKAAWSSGDTVYCAAGTDVLTGGNFQIGGNDDNLTIIADEGYTLSFPEAGTSVIDRLDGCDGLHISGISFDGGDIRTRGFWSAFDGLDCVLNQCDARNCSENGFRATNATGPTVSSTWFIGGVVDGIGGDGLYIADGGSAVISDFVSVNVDQITGDGDCYQISGEDVYGHLRMARLYGRRESGITKGCLVAGGDTFDVQLVEDIVNDVLPAVAAAGSQYVGAGTEAYRVWNRSYDRNPVQLLPETDLNPGDRWSHYEAFISICESTVATDTPLLCKLKDNSKFRLVQSVMYATRRGVDATNATTQTMEFRNNLVIGSNAFSVIRVNVSQSYDAAGCWYYAASGTTTWKMFGDANATDAATWLTISGETVAGEADPGVLSLANHDYRLQSASPLIGAGVRWWGTDPPPQGYDGLRFPLRGGLPDIGAYALRPGEDGAVREAGAYAPAVLEAGVDVAKARAP